MHTPVPSGAIDKKEIFEGLRQIGVTPGMSIMVHSSLRAFGWVVGGPEAVIAALMDAVGPQGTILMPSFNHGAPFQPGGPNLFDPARTPTLNGRIPSVFWRMSGVMRSLNPTHPYAAWGRNAERYVSRHHLTLTMGEDSPLGLLARDGGYQLNLGTTHETTTAKHLAETLHRSPCLGLRTDVHRVRLPDGRIALHRTWSYRAQHCPLTESGELIEAGMERLHLQRKTRIGRATVTFFRVKDLLRVVWELLEHGSGPYPPCVRCPIRPLRSPATQASDWVDDPEALAAARKELLGL